MIDFLGAPYLKFAGNLDKKMDLYLSNALDEGAGQFAPLHQMNSIYLFESQNKNQSQRS
jgi:hypothetical protein